MTAIAYTNSPQGQTRRDTHAHVVLGGTNSDQGQATSGAQTSSALVGTNPPQGHAPADAQARDALGGTNSDQGQMSHDAHARLALVGTDSPHGHSRLDAHKPPALGGTNSDQGHAPRDTQGGHALVGTNSPQGQGPSDAHIASALGGTDPAGDASSGTPPKGKSRPLLDPLLTLASITLDDLEHLRLAQENRYRSLTTTGVSDGGVEWGYGLDDNDPQIAAAGAMVAAIKGLEDDAVLNLKRLMRKHPLGPWVKAHRGVGDKQAARLLGAIGDPYWHTAENRPRTVSELWAYCGLHTLPARHVDADAHASRAGGEYNVAARRRKGQQANWSDEAKKRVWLIATKCMMQLEPECKEELKRGLGHLDGCRCSTYRLVYDHRRDQTKDRVHQVDCVRCGPSGHPAKPGTPWSLQHKKADALRIMSKAILRDLWRASRDIHEGAQS